MTDRNGQSGPEELQQVFDDIGLTGFMEQIGGLQESLSRVAEGMQALGENAVKQVRDTENLAAHILAIEAVLTVMLRQMPVDPTEVRDEALRRTRGIDHDPAAGPSVVVQLAEDILKRADD